MRISFEPSDSLQHVADLLSKEHAFSSDFVFIQVASNRERDTCVVTILFYSFVVVALSSSRIQ